MIAFIYTKKTFDNCYLWKMVELLTLFFYNQSFPINITLHWNFSEITCKQSHFSLVLIRWPSWDDGILCDHLRYCYPKMADAKLVFPPFFQFTESLLNAKTVKKLYFHFKTYMLTLSLYASINLLNAFKNQKIWLVLNSNFSSITAISWPENMYQ